MTEFTAAAGFTVTEQLQTVSVRQAAELLLSRKRRRYTSAERSQGGITLRRHIWHCPYCEARIPAYARTLECDDTGMLADRRETAAWLSELSFFDEDNTLLLQTPFSGNSAICPNCSTRSQRIGQAHPLYPLVLTEHGGKITLQLRLCTIADAMDAENVLRRGRQFHISGFPLQECLTFDLRRGRVFLQLRTQDGSLLSGYDLTNDFSAWNDGLLRRLLHSRRILRELKRAFLRQWQGPLPFCEKELDLERFWLMTRFVGYPRSFYDALPLFDCGFAFDRSLRPVAARLHTPSDAARVLKDTRLLQAKSVRRICANRPALLFFLPELSAMRSVVPDINHFTRLLDAPFVFRLLTQLHIYPNAALFFRALTGRYSAAALFRSAEKNVDLLFAGARRYCAMSSLWQKQMIAQWDSSGYLHCTDKLSVPMHSTGALVPYQAGSYNFIPLHCGTDYHAAGTALHNCLSSWTDNDFPVVIVRQLDRTVAAIEVRGTEIRQFRGFENMRISPQSQLGRAYNRWRRRFGLTENFITYA